MHRGLLVSLPSRSRAAGPGFSVKSPDSFNSIVQAKFIGSAENSGTSSLSPTRAPAKQ